MTPGELMAAGVFVLLFVIAYAIVRRSKNKEGG